MVNKMKTSNGEYYQCDVCKFHYEDKEWASKCQAWCEKNRSCNINITKHVVDVR